MRKILLITLLLGGMFFFSGHIFLSYCQVAPDETSPKVLKGRVSDIDWVNSTITISWVQPNGKNDEMTFKLVYTTRVAKDNDYNSYLSVSQVMEGDEVTVEYEVNTNSYGSLVAKKITILPP